MDEDKRAQSQTLSGINFILGAWLVASPYIFGYLSAPLKWNQIIAGLAVVFFSSFRYAAPQLEWPSRLNLLAAIWLIVSPFLLNDASGVSYWNQLIIGVLVVLFAAWNISTRPRSYFTR